MQAEFFGTSNMAVKFLLEGAVLLLAAVILSAVLK
jgi:hypothetical protein